MSEEGKVTFTIALPGELAEDIRLGAECCGMTPEQAIETRLADRRPLAQPHHETALALLRAKAMEQAAQLGNPGEQGWETNHRAEALLEFVLKARA